MKKIKLDVPIELTYYNDEDQKAAEIMKMLVEKTLSQENYATELQAVVDKAVEDVRGSIVFIPPQRTKRDYK